MSDLFSVRIGNGVFACACCCNPLCFDLTAQTLSGCPGLTPLMPGKDWSLRLWVGDRFHQSVNLTGATVTMVIKRVLTDPVGITRQTGVAIAGADPARNQIVLDDQTIDNGPGGVTGRGWFTLNFARNEADLVRSIAPYGCYDLSILFATPENDFFLSGRLQSYLTAAAPC